MKLMSISQILSEYDGAEYGAELLLKHAIEHLRKHINGANLAGELIAMIRINAMRGTLQLLNNDNMDDELKPWIDRLHKLQSPTP